MSFIKSSITDTCPHCGGSGEINTPISIPTSHASYPGYAYDEAWEPCGPCAGTGEDLQLVVTGRSLERAAEEHEAVLQTREERLAQAIQHEREGSAWIL